MKQLHDTTEIPSPRTVSIKTCVCPALSRNSMIQIASVVAGEFPRKELSKRQYVEIVGEKDLVISTNGFVIGTVLCVLAIVFPQRTRTSRVFCASVFFYGIYNNSFHPMSLIPFDNARRNAVPGFILLATAVANVRKFAKLLKFQSLQEDKL